MNSCSVYIANSTCANVDTFVLSVFPSQVWRRNLLILVVDPQRRRMFLVRRFYYLLNFQLFRKGSHAEGMLFIFPCSLAFSPKCSREEFGCSLSRSLSHPPSEFPRFTCLPPVWPPHLPACPACLPWTVRPSLHSISFTPAGCFA